MGVLGPIQLIGRRHGEYPLVRDSLRYTFYYRSEGKIFVAKNGFFLEKEFLSKEVSWRKVELDEVTVPAPLLESSTSQKTVSATPTPISEEANDNDHELQDKILLNLVDQPERDLHQSGTVILFWKSCC